MRITNIKILMIFILLISVFLTSVIYADTLRLLDSSLITGKIINVQEGNILIANQGGVFKVKQKYVEKIHRTNSFQQDIEVYRSYGDPTNPDHIKHDYQAGVRRKEKMAKLFDIEEKVDVAPEQKEKIKLNRRHKRESLGYYGDWNYGRLSFSFAYFTTFLSDLAMTKNSNEVLPTGISVTMSYDQGLEFKKRSMFIPGIKLNHTYYYFTKDLFRDDIKEISGHEINLGLVWIIPGMNSKKGAFTLFALPGASIIFIHNRKSHRFVKSTTFAFKCGMGYEIRYKKVTFQFHINYTYLIDTLVSFNSIGGSFGLAFKLW